MLNKLTIGIGRKPKNGTGTSLLELIFSFLVLVLLATIVEGTALAKVLMSSSDVSLMSAWASSILVILLAGIMVVVVVEIVVPSVLSVVEATVVVMPLAAELSLVIPGPGFCEIWPPGTLSMAPKPAAGFGITELAASEETDGLLPISVAEDLLVPDLDPDSIRLLLLDAKIANGSGPKGTGTTEGLAMDELGREELGMDGGWITVLCGRPPWDEKLEYSEGPLVFKLDEKL